ncbi:MAG: HEPN domain-containing protein [Candidatus Aenigmarchaeota archaeon]|nr:HEPN domain-containing protein [Candidatus Aenigmarchaeota archaeon]NCS71340.1 HEPN domain-containing protein [Candidatus Aenigmarchaeota archaeon]
MNLENSDKWEKIRRDENLIEKALLLAERDLKVSLENKKMGNNDWAFSIAYNSMLQSGRALMFHSGYRPKGEYKHVAVAEFLRNFPNEKLAEKLIFIFNKMRKKRHTIVYEEADIISDEEARKAVEDARVFFERAKSIIKK